MKLRKGFTLIELLVVVAIIGVLIMIAVPQFTKMTDGARKSAAEANHRTIVSCIMLYMADHGGSVPSVSDLEALLPLDPVTGAAQTFTTMSGKPDGSTYSYVSDPATGTFTLTTQLDSATIAEYTK